MRIFVSGTGPVPDQGCSTKWNWARKPSLRSRGILMANPPHEHDPPQPNLRGQNWPKDVVKIPLWDDLVQGGDEPILGEGVGWGSNKAPHLHIQFGASHLSLALHDPFLPMSGWAAPWNSSTCIRGSTSLGAGHGEVMSHWRDTKEETGQVQCQWGIGKWACIANRPNPFLSIGWRPKVR